MQIKFSNKRFFLYFSILIIFLYSLLFDSCKFSQSKKAHEGFNPRQGVYYSLFVRSFADSNGDGIGDFNGIAQNLEYLSSLGISGIWLLPIYPSHSYHGYDVDNYYEVNPEYGSMEDFENLVSQCHERGIAVMLDITFNHSSVHNEWFVASKNPTDPHRNWYRWLSSDEAAHRLNQKIWGHALWNECNGSYYSGEFYDGMPDYNLDCKELREELKRVLAFWIDKGVSGFRFDAAGHIYDKIKMPEGFSDSIQSSVGFWKEISEFVKQRSPESYCVAEVWDKSGIRAQFLSGLESVFHFDIGDTYIQNILTTKNAGNNKLAHVLENDYTACSSFNPNFIDAPFLTNHDQARAASLIKGGAEPLKVAAGMYILTQGIPFIYYGEELGMKSGARDESKRTPFLWSNTQDGKKAKIPNFQTTWASDDDSVYNAKTEGVKQQEKDKNSLLNYYKRLVAFRNACPAFKGKLTAFDTGNKSLCTWIMSHQEKNAFVVHNISETEQEVSLPEGYSYPSAFCSKPVKDNKNGSVVLQPMSTAVFCK